MLSIANLQVSVADTPILRGLSLDVPAGEVYAIMGPNRAGESALSCPPAEAQLVAISLEGGVV